MPACGDDSSPTADATQSPSDAAPTVDAACPKVWTVTAHTASATAVVEAGVVRLSDVDTPQNPAIEIFQGGITGDFDLTFSFSAFAPAGTGAFLQASIAQDVALSSRFVVAGIGTHPVVGVGVAELPDDGDPGPQLVATGEVEGSMRYRRTGNTLIVTAMTSDATAEITLTDFDESPLRTGVQIGSNMGTLSGTTSVAISQFTITGGGGTVQSDTFDCDSLIAP